MRLIDADALIEAHYQYCNEHHGEADCFYTWSLLLMKNAPSIEPKRGKWTDFSMSKGVPIERCSECGEWSYEMGKNFCPHCGARMKGEER